MHIDVDDLALVSAIHEQGSVTRAADQLHITQSAASWRLGKLEERVGAPLFRRTGRGMRANALGERLWQTARRVLGDLEEARRDLAALRDGSHGTIRFTSECYTSYHWLPRLLGSFQELHPHVEVQIVVEATEDPLPFVSNGRIDIALMTKVEEAKKDGDLTQRELFEDEMVAVTASGHPWAQLSHIEAEHFSDQHLIVYQRYAPERTSTRPLPLPKGATPARITTFPMTTEAVIEMVRASMGVTVMASWAAANYIAQGGLAQTRITQSGMHRMWYAVWRRDLLPVHLDDFIGQLQALHGGLHDHLSGEPARSVFQ